MKMYQDLNPILVYGIAAITLRMSGIVNNADYVLVSLYGIYAATEMEMACERCSLSSSQDRRKYLLRSAAPFVFCYMLMYHLLESEMIYGRFVYDYRFLLLITGGITLLQILNIIWNLQAFHIAEGQKEPPVLSR